MTVDPARLVAREAQKPKVKRVFSSVSVAEEGGRFRVLLDGKPVRSPLRHLIETPSRALADALAAEWNAQDPFIEPEAMPLTRLTATAIDQVAPRRDEIIDALLGFVDADALCYRAPEPARLCERQRGQWQPVLDWLAAEFEVPLKSTDGILPLQQPPDAVRGYRKLLAALDDAALNAFQAAVAKTNSLALAAALVKGRLTAAEVCAAALLDEIFQAEEWGEDPASVQRRRLIASEIDAIGRYIALVREA